MFTQSCNGMQKLLCHLEVTERMGAQSMAKNQITVERQIMGRERRGGGLACERGLVI